MVETAHCKQEQTARVLASAQTRGFVLKQPSNQAPMLHQALKSWIKTLARLTGHEIIKARPVDNSFKLGCHPVNDIGHFLKNVENPVIIDVGANIGQTVDRYRQAFQGALIHSFEPSPSTYQVLNSHCAEMSNVWTWHAGVGSCSGEMELLENIHSDMSSFLAPGSVCWGEVARRTQVPVVALDDFAEDRGLGCIHLLKSDTQGFELEVFKGAKKLMSEERIGLIYCEMIFSEQYKGLPPCDEILRYLRDHGFSLVTYYQPFFQNDLLSWTDMLFINRSFYRKWKENAPVSS
jgi:FkbM family methyltransferase